MSKLSFTIAQNTFNKLGTYDAPHKTHPNHFLHDNKVLTKKIYVDDYAMLIWNVGIVSTGKINANILD